MGVVVDQDVAGSGLATFAGSDLLFAVLHLTDIGQLARRVDSDNLDRLTHVGFFSFGDRLSAIGGVDRDYWRLPVWVNWVDTLWTPDPSTFTASPGTVTAEPMTLFATRVRWGLFGGATGHLYVVAQ